LSGTTSSARQSATLGHAAARSCSSRRASLGILAGSAGLCTWLWFSIATIVAKSRFLMFSLGALLGWRDAKRGGLEMEDLGIFALFFDGIFVFFSDLGILSSWSFRLEREQEKRCNCKVFLLSVVFWYGFWFGVQNGGRV
jgi:hypothetical protein